MATQKGNNDLHRRGRFIPPFLGLVAILIVGLFGSSRLSLGVSGASISKEDQVEPQAGTWKTWVLDSGDQIHLPAPPSKQESKDEIDQLEDLANSRDAAALERIAYWNTSAPAYRWNRIALDEALAINMNSLHANRAMALLNVAIYDATVAAWYNKYDYNRPRPTDLDPTFDAAIPTPNSPSYPSEHAVAAGAASEVLAYLFPEKAETFREMAEEAGQSFLLAGTQYPSDVDQGLDLGREVAALVVERAKADGSDVPWTGTVPTGPGLWSGQNPVLPLAGTWKPWVLASGDEFRPGEPLKYDSAEKAAEMEILRTIERKPVMVTHAFFWEFGAGGVRNYVFWNEQAERMLLEKGLGDNPPRAARVLALVNVTLYDATVATWDAKYYYWAIRPFQLDPEFKPLFTTPNHPSYPAAHATFSTAAAEMLAYLFPSDADDFRAYANEAGESRTWAGIHFPSDVTAGNALAQNVANKIIQYASQDGSQ